VPPVRERIGERGRTVVTQNLSRVVTGLKGHGFDLRGAPAEQMVSADGGSAAGAAGVERDQHARLG